MKNVFITYVTLFFILYIIDTHLPKVEEVEQTEVEEVNSNFESKSEKKIKKDFKRKVTLTTYNAVEQQCDSTPNVTASGFEINMKNPKKHRIIAVSRDLKRHFKWGEKVVLENAGKYSGVWYVRDLMNSRFRNKIDILINETDKHTKLVGVVVRKI